MKSAPTFLWRDYDKIHAEISELYGVATLDLEKNHRIFSQMTSIDFADHSKHDSIEISKAITEILACFKQTDDIQVILASHALLHTLQVQFYTISSPEALDRSLFLNISTILKNYGFVLIIKQMMRLIPLVKNEKTPNSPQENEQFSVKFIALRNLFIALNTIMIVSCCVVKSADVHSFFPPELGPKHILSFGEIGKNLFKLILDEIVDFYHRHDSLIPSHLHVITLRWFLLTTFGTVEDAYAKRAAARKLCDLPEQNSNRLKYLMSNGQVSQHGSSDVKVSTNDLQEFQAKLGQSYFYFDSQMRDLDLCENIPYFQKKVLNLMRKKHYISAGEVQREREKNFRKYPNTSKQPILSSCKITEKFFILLYPVMDEFSKCMMELYLSSFIRANFGEEEFTRLDPTMQLWWNLDGIQPKLLPQEKLRFKEIFHKSVNHILFILIKHFKCNHIIQFDCLLSSLFCTKTLHKFVKFIRAHSMDFMRQSTRMEQENFPCISRKFSISTDKNGNLIKNETEAETKLIDKNYSWRKIFILSTCMMIVNKIVKPNELCAMILCVYKAIIPLRSFLQNNVEPLRTYTLKIMGYLVKYQGISWKSQNISMITEIIQNVRRCETYITRNFSLQPMSVENKGFSSTVKNLIEVEKQKEASQKIHAMLYVSRILAFSTDPSNDQKKRNEKLIGWKTVVEDVDIIQENVIQRLEAYLEVMYPKITGCVVSSHNSQTNPQSQQSIDYILLNAPARILDEMILQPIDWSLIEGYFAAK